MGRIFAAIIVLAGLFVAAPVATADPPSGLSVWGPHHLSFGAALTVQGWAPQAGDPVTVHYRYVGWNLWSTVTTHAGSDRHYEVTFPPDIGADLTFYATSGSITSAHWHHVQLDRLSCTTGAPAFLTNPVAGTPDWPAVSFVALTAVRDGTWAGVAANDHGQFAVLSWRHHHPVRVLARYDYQTGSGAFAFDATSTVHVAAITPKGSVVADVEDLKKDARYAVAWTADGAAHRLRIEPTWTYIHVVGVTDSGRIVGVASTGVDEHASAYVVWWNSAVSAPHVVTHIGFPAPSVAIDGQGDIAYSLANDQARIRLADGDFRTLGTTSGDRYLYPSVGTTAMIYGSDTDRGQLIRWDLSHATSSGEIIAQDYAKIHGAYHAAGAGGHVILDNTGAFYGPNPYHLAAPDHRYADLPDRFVPADAAAVDSQGTVAYTAAGDHLPHLFRCH